MKFLFLIGSLKKGGAERNLAKVASSLAAIGHDVEIALYERQVEFTLHESIKIIDLNVMRYKGFSRILYIYLSVFRIVWGKHPNKAVAFTRLSSQFLAATLYPRIICRYDIYPFYMKKRRWISSLILFNFPNVRKVVSPSEELYQLLLPFFIKKSKVIIIQNPVAEITRQVQTHPYHEWWPEKPFIVVAGRLSQQKRVDIVLRAYAIADLKSKYQLLILGDGDQKTKLEQLALELNIANSVIFAGFVKEPYPVIEKAKVLVLASDKEGFPNVLVEALSLGVPVISSDCPTGPKEIVRNGYNGFLFPMGNAHELSLRLSEVLDNDDLYKKMVVNSKLSTTIFKESLILKKWQDLLIS
ncbi:MAG: glycosyltransferase [Chitinophagaceae bacterium]